MAYGVIGNTTVSGTVILGSSPGRPAPRSSSGLGRRPLTPVTRVQIPYGVRIKPSELFSEGVFLYLEVVGCPNPSAGPDVPNSPPSYRCPCHTCHIDLGKHFCTRSAWGCLGHGRLGADHCTGRYRARWTCRIAPMSTPRPLLHPSTVRSYPA